MADEELPRSGLFVRVRAIVREHRAAYVRVVCDPPDDSVVGFEFVLGGLVVPIRRVPQDVRSDAAEQAVSKT